MTPDAAAIAVKSTTGGYTAAGVWTGVGLFVAFLIALIKIAPRWRELGIGARRTDIDDLRDRVADLEKKVDVATVAAHDAEMRLIFAVNAVQLLMGKIRADNPNDPILKQAAELLAAATNGAMPGISAALMKGLNDIKGIGEHGN